MGNRSAKFISTLVASIVAGAPLAAVSQTTPSAPATTAATADDCLASPKASAPQGQHWFYRFDRSTKKKCWYMRAEGDKAAQTTQTTQAAAAPAPQKPDTPTPQRTLQDAHAEFVQQQPPAASTGAAMANQGAPTAQPQAAPRVTAAADNSPQQPAATRWPDTSNAAAPQQDATAPAPEAQPAQQPAASPAPVALAAADAAIDKPTGSLQMLLLVVGGALALAGIIGSVIYRFAGRRLRRAADDNARRSHWDDWEPHDREQDRAPWVNAVHTAPVQRPRPVDFDLARRRAARPAITDDLDAIQPLRSVVNEAHEARDVEAFDEDASAPQLAAIDAYVEEVAAHGPGTEESHAEEPELELAHHDEADVEDMAKEMTDDDTDTVDIDVITKMLERLAKEGPRLDESRPGLGLRLSPEAGPAGFAQTRRGQSAARA